MRTWERTPLACFFGAHASGVLLLEGKTSTPEACPPRGFSEELLMSSVTTPRNDENLGAHASGVLLLGNQTSTPEACAPRGFSGELFMSPMRRPETMKMEFANG
jgi:hypothetical protein